jgi:excisionase family DNA binding protein
VADYLGISRRSVQRLIDRGALPNCMDFSQPDSSRKLMRIPRESIIAYMAKMNRDRPDDPKE